MTCIFQDVSVHKMKLFFFFSQKRMGILQKMRKIMKWCIFWNLNLQNHEGEHKKECIHMQKAEKMPTASSLPVCKKLSHYDGRRVVRHGEVCWGDMSSSKFGCHLKSDAGCTNCVQAPLFSPIFSGSQPATSSLVGKEETATEDKRRRLRRLVLSWPFLTRRRRHNQVENFRDITFGAGRF